MTTQRPQFTLKALFVFMTTVAIVAATVPWWVDWIRYAIVVADVGQEIAINGTLSELVTMGVAATVSGMLTRSLAVALRDTED
ncbi:MAG TPA: hypothetical protein VHC22_24815 [Pirellulales bacterium]|nr:hypothetical protein [Pirellulales bacterium]